LLLRGNNSRPQLLSLQEHNQFLLVFAVVAELVR
jgi:hypothetical protein